MIPLDRTSLYDNRVIPLDRTLLYDNRVIPVDIDNFSISGIIRFATWSKCNSITIKKTKWIPKEISNIQTLKYIDLRICDIVDISPLLNCKLLELIDLDYNKVVDITPLSKCTSLRELYISHNKIVDI